MTQTAELVEPNVQAEIPASLVHAGVLQVSPPVEVSAKISPMIAPTVAHAVKPVAPVSYAPTAGVWCRVLQAKKYVTVNVLIQPTMTQTAVAVG